MDASEIARQFALGKRAKLSGGPVARGRQGEVWRLDTSDGAWAVKVPFEPSTKDTEATEDIEDTEDAEDAVAASTAFHEAAHAAGVPTPAVRRAADGRVFACGVRVYEWVDLLSPTTDLDPVVVGEIVATMHRVPYSEPGPVHPWYVEPVGAERWDELVYRLTREGAPFAGRLAALRDELVALESWLDPPRQTRTCHRDLWADNVLPVAGGGVCVIDWENSGPCDPGQELACVLFEYARGDPGRARALYGAYHRAGGPATVERREDFTMLIAQLGHITEMAASDWLEPNVRSPRRSDSAAWIGEVLTEPHTRELLDSLLEAVV